MGFRKRGSRLGNIINSTKNVVDASNVLVAGTDTTILTVVDGVAANTINPANFNQVLRGAKVHGFYLSLFFALDVNQAGIGSIPLLDWNVFYNKSGMVSGTFSASDPTKLPTPGATGNNTNRNQILHESKGLIGEKNDGSKMVFEGVIRVPKSFQRIAEKTKILINARCNFDAVFCAKAIYKWYE